MRHAGSDARDGEEMSGWQAKGRLTRLIVAVSGGAGHFPQNADSTPCFCCAIVREAQEAWRSNGFFPNS